MHKYKLIVVLNKPTELLRTTHENFPISNYVKRSQLIIIVILDNFLCLHLIRHSRVLNALVLKKNIQYQIYDIYPRYLTVALELKIATRITRVFIQNFR